MGNLSLGVNFVLLSGTMGSYRLLRVRLRANTGFNLGNVGGAS
jgi:hypothetical protein